MRARKFADLVNEVYYFYANQTLQAQVLQASGAALNVSGGKWTILRVVAL